eukprot:CAMPEP_0170248538 /NCGR_PEP_ID=MMETSP0116_2-20130129/24064_1 /TAXON_ID=400756 /ORGANISM="Durinskia baltica, Strain CSIRO CS-38" /LENGTH=530 /DNA_ID=CAMNT_0010499431 /DNA_START=122 /DNA_END=1711 /DNA_ORIENTATION=+
MADLSMMLVAQQSDAAKHLGHGELLDRPLHRGGRARSMGRRMGEGPRPPSEGAPVVRRPGAGKSGSQVRVRSGARIHASPPAELPKVQLESSFLLQVESDRSAIVDCAKSFVSGLISSAVFDQEAENDEHEIEVEYDMDAETEFEFEAGASQAETMSPTVSEEDERIEELRHRTCQAFISGAKTGQLFSILSGIKARYQAQPDYSTSTTAESEEEEMPQAPAGEELNSLKIDVFQTLLEGVLSGSFETAIMTVRQEKAAAQEQDAAELVRMQMLKVLTDAAVDGSLERALADVAASRAASREEQDMMDMPAEDFDEVVSLGSLDAEEDEEMEALGYVQMALGYAKRAVAKGVACDAELDEEQDQDDVMTTRMDEVSEIDELEERAQIREILMEMLCDPVERQQEPQKSFRRLPSVGTWHCLPVLPTPSPVARAEAPAPAAMPIALMPSVGKSSLSTAGDKGVAQLKARTPAPAAAAAAPAMPMGLKSSVAAWRLPPSGVAWLAKLKAAQPPAAPAIVPTATVSMEEEKKE